MTHFERTELEQAEIYYGGDYNPEQWPPAIWREDVRLMQEAGVNLATLGVFSWAKLEPQPGRYDFGWFDEIVGLLHENGIGICLATATASPPPWLAKHHPESLPVTADGVTLWPGGRQAYCPHSVAYREAAGALVRQLATRYGQHPAVKLWHINNEYACHVSECFCDVSAAAFRDWLKAKYGTLEALNDAWGTAFWSQQYGAWDEIMPPRKAPTFANPTQQLDWRRFSSDSLLSLMDMEGEILRQLSPGKSFTTNFMGNFKPLDYWKWAAHEDVVSMDIYPDPAEPQAEIHMALNADLMRSLGKGRPWMLMEQTSSRVNWRAQNAPKAPGQMRLWSYLALARGANSILFFQWRASRAGAEKFHSAMVPHGEVGESRVWDEVAQLGNELGRLSELLPSRVRAEIAILMDWNNWWALELDSHPSTDLRLVAEIRSHYMPLYESNIAVDFAYPGSDLSAYKLVIVPNLYLVSEPDAANITEYVRQGGTAVVTYFSGIVNENDHVALGGYPAPFRELLGLRIEDFVPLQSNENVGIRLQSGEVAKGTLWSEIIHLDGAEALAWFAEGYAADSPAVTRHHFGSGMAYYLGTRLAPSALLGIYREILDNLSLRPLLTLPHGVEAVQRQSDEANYLFLLNHNREPVTVPLEQLAGVDLLSGEERAGSLTLDALGLQILRLGNVPD